MKTADQAYYADCLKADLPRALKRLQKTRAKDTAKVKLLRKKAVARFGSAGELQRKTASDDFVDDVIQIYRSYYRDVLLAPAQVRRFDARLSKDLRDLFARLGVKLSPRISTQSLDRRLLAEFRKRGFFALMGTVTPFRSLLVWKKQTSKSYQVLLPEGRQKVRVVFLEKFLERGWLHYATFGKYSVGGWAKKDGLYCVKQAYQIESPTFKVHYLAHEAQHFADYKRYPKLKQADLEYRAKLTELALTRSPRRFLRRLRAEAKKDPAIPHSFAAYKILEELKKDPSPALARQRAFQLLARHTNALKNHRARTCAGLLSANART